MANVKKRSGKVQAFSPAKIRRGIERAAKEAKLSPAKTKKLVDDILSPVIVYAKKKRSIKAVDLRRSILGRIDRRHKKVSAAWKRFDKKRH